MGPGGQVDLFHGGTLHRRCCAGWPQGDQQQRGFGRGDKNQASVRLELQADFLAGVWAHHAQQKFDYLDPGDVDQALQTASAIGDDRLQKEMQGYVVPDSFTHGTSEQRKRWFQNGFKSGQPSACNTLSNSL